MTGRIFEAGHTTAPDHMPDRAKNRLHPRGRPHTSGLPALPWGGYGEIVSISDDGHDRDVRVAAGRKRRIWSDAEKRMICAQTRVPGVSVSQVARRYDANANLVFSWLRDPRFAPDEAAVEGHTAFLPVEILDESREPRCDVAATAPEGRIELELAGGHRLRIVGSDNPEALARLIRGLAP